MKNIIKSIEIKKLYGCLNYLIEIKDNKLIIIGENGSGKTTISRIIYYTLSCNWDSLISYDFETIELKLNSNQKINIEYNVIKNVYENEYIERFERRFDESHYQYDRRINDFVIKDLMNFRYNYSEINKFEDINYIPFPQRYIERIFKDENVNKLYSITKKIKDNFNTQILYLPTYRRIEEQIKNIFPYLDTNKIQIKKRTNDNSIELIEFGMNDVKDVIAKFIEMLNNYSHDKQNVLTLGYLSDIIEGKYDTLDKKRIKKLSEDEIEKILNRIDTKLLSIVQQRQIKEIINDVNSKNKKDIKDKEKIVCNYFLKLLDFDKEMNNEEKPLIDFVDKCNKYLVNNRILYNKKDREIKIHNITNLKEEHEVNIQNLSSGEKQIVSLFSKLYLSKNDDYFILIDEPELSLSVNWQKSFLVDIIESGKCCGLIATTHSPFIFDNDLEDYVHGINEFKK